jgi:hypothetical protein
MSHAHHTALVLCGHGSAWVVSHRLITGVWHPDRYTPLHGAGFQGRPEITKVLIAHGLDVNAKHTDGEGPVQRAIWGREPRHLETAQVMLEAGARLSGTERPVNEDMIALVATWTKNQGSAKEDL